MGCRGSGRVRFPGSDGIGAPRFWQWRHLQLLAVKAGQGKMRKVDREPTVVLGQQADALSPENFAQKHVVLLPTKITLRPHTAYQHGPRILEFRHALRKRSRRGLIERRWRLHFKRFVRTHLIVFLTKAVQCPLLFAAGCRRRRGGLRHGAVAPLAPFLVRRVSPATWLP